MNLRKAAKIVAVAMVACLAFGVAAKEPIFVKWLVIDDPGDETIRAYWQRAEAGELSAEELVDLGTMLFYRGWPNDAIDFYRQALKLEPKMSEAWFRIGLVKHRTGDLAGAKSAYRKCLKRQSGHGWANFYLGLLEEQSGDGRAAMEHYERAFKHAPELADPAVNPEILSSELQLGARVRHADGERFERGMPMRFLDPRSVHEVHRQFVPTPTPVPTPVLDDEERRAEPAAAAGSAPRRGASPGARGSRTGSTSSAQGTAGTRSGTAAAPTSRGTGAEGTELPDPGSTPYGFPTPPPAGAGGAPSERGASPRIGDTSPEAFLEPLWPGLYDLIEAIV
jgi:hypothetical protein